MKNSVRSNAIEDVRRCSVLFIRYSFRILVETLNIEIAAFSDLKETPWPKSASELYRPSDPRLSAKLVPTLPGRGCHVVSVTDPYGRSFSFLDRITSLTTSK
jgi:hypothetical protein